jgi:hypothetical protein
MVIEDGDLARDGVDFTEPLPAVYWTTRLARD